MSGQTYYDNANTVLATHAGFDNNGNVKDPVQARTTLQSARQDFMSFRQTLQAALKNLRQTIQEFRQANGLNNRISKTRRRLPSRLFRRANPEKYTEPYTGRQLNVRQFGF